MMQKSAWVEIIGILLRPLVRFSVRHAIPIQDFTKVVKVAYVELAAEEIEHAGETINISRLSVLTGLYRKDVTRIFREKKAPCDTRESVLERVIGQWRHDSTFTTKTGSPRVLTYGGDGSDFARLVKTVTTAIKPGAILFHLERMGTVSKEKKTVKLLREMTALSIAPRQGFSLLARDLDTLLRAGEENLLNDLDDKGISNLHARTEYDNVFRKNLPEIRKWFIEEGKIFHRRAREFISQFDKDVNPGDEAEPAGEQVVLSTVSLTRPLAEMADKARKLMAASR